MMKKIVSIVLLSCCAFPSSYIYAQETKDKLEAINEYVHFLNESIHGMLISHRLLENYNQEVNKYVDLDSYIINNFSNADLPKDIFTDPENWFYDTSPEEWKQKASENSTLPPTVKQDFVKDINGMRAVLARINKLRFEVENLIATKNLKVRSELVEVYEKLEQGEADYEEFYVRLNTFNKKLQSLYKSSKPNLSAQGYDDVYKAMFKIYMTARLSLMNIRKKEDDQLPKFLTDLNAGIQQLEAIDFTNHPAAKLKGKTAQKLKSNILEQAKEAASKLNTFITDGSVPVEFKNHGRYYFYYNSDVIHNFNRYGNGMVFEMNRILDLLGAPTIRFMEIPHYYKVIYPEKISKNKPIAATNPNIQNAPKNIKSRDVIAVSEKIMADSLSFTVELFDSKIKDGDIISFNFNKDWLLNKQKLSDKPLKLKLELNEEGKNFFILHSDDMGRNPPTTIGIRYYYKGEANLITLSSNLNTSEMIEIIYTP